MRHLNVFPGGKQILNDASGLATGDTDQPDCGCCETECSCNVWTQDIEFINNPGGSYTVDLTQYNQELVSRAESGFHFDAAWLMFNPVQSGESYAIYFGEFEVRLDMNPSFRPRFQVIQNGVPVFSFSPTFGFVQGFGVRACYNARLGNVNILIRWGGAIIDAGTFATLNASGNYGGTAVLVVAPWTQFTSTLDVRDGWSCCHECGNTPLASVGAMAAPPAKPPCKERRGKPVVRLGKRRGGS